MNKQPRKGAVDRLTQLRRIVQEVNSARDLSSVLDIIVSRVQSALNAQVCSVYLLNPKLNRHILMATEGLNQSYLGKVSLATGEGLVGQVALREEIVNIEDAKAHPKFQSVPGLGEENFGSFLGVPIIHHGIVLGVLVLQRIDRKSVV